MIDEIMTRISVELSGFQKHGEMGLKHKHTAIIQRAKSSCISVAKHISAQY